MESKTQNSQENVGTITLSYHLTMKILGLFDPSLHFFGQHFALSVGPFAWQNLKFYQLFENIIESQYRHFSNYRQIIDSDLRSLEIIGDFKSLSISISKIPGKLSKNYR